jgi:hypothetical protein
MLGVIDNASKPLAQRQAAASQLAKLTGGRIQVRFFKHPDGRVEPDVVVDHTKQGTTQAERILSTYQVKRGLRRHADRMRANGVPVPANLLEEGLGHQGTVNSILQSTTPAARSAPEDAGLSPEARLRQAIGPGQPPPRTRGRGTQPRTPARPVLGVFGPRGPQVSVGNLFDALEAGEKRRREASRPLSESFPGF